MDRKQFLTKLALGSALIAVLAVFMNADRTLPWIWQRIMAVLSPVAGGIAIAFLLSIPARAIEKGLAAILRGKMLRFSRGLSLLLSVILILIFLAAIFSLVLPEFIHACTILIDSLRNFASDEAFWAGIDLSRIPFLEEIFGGIDEGITTLAELLESRLQELSEPILSFTIQSLISLISGTVAFFVAFVFSCYFIMNEKMLKRHVKAVLSLCLTEEMIRKTEHVISTASIAFSRFITAQVAESLIIGMLCFIGMLLLRLPYAAAISAFTGLMALIPIYGAFAGAAVGAFIIAVVNPWQGVLFLVFIFVLQQLEGDLIYPRVVGTSTGLPSVYVFASVTLGGALFGIAGMVTAVPVFSTIYILLKEKLSENEASARPDHDAET